MKITKQIITRRELLNGIAATSFLSVTGLAKAQYSNATLPESSHTQTAFQIARDENFWKEVANHYEKTVGITNLEHGYWGKMAKPVQQHYLSATSMVNAQNSFYARKEYDADYQISVKRVADALGVNEDEIVLTRNATESIHNLIRQYRDLKQGDSVLFADLDYPSFKTTMRWLKKSTGANTIQLNLPTLANQKQLLKLYIEAFDNNPKLKLMLLTHVSNQHGLVLPIKQISTEARKRGIDIICDNAQSWGLIDYKINDLDVDMVGFNLHKWIGTPLGVGALYIKRGSLHKIAPYPGDKDPDNTDISKRVHVATSNFASVISIPAALDFHQAIGGKNKEARLRYLRSLWTNKAKSLPNIEILGGADEESWTGMASFRLRGQTSIEQANQLQQRLEKEFGVFTVIRTGLSSGACVRITPQVFNTPEDIEKLLSAITKISS